MVSLSKVEGLIPKGDFIVIANDAFAILSLADQFWPRGFDSTMTELSKGHPLLPAAALKT